jgi:membrane fusion protein (multidrug efflux system)
MDRKLLLPLVAFAALAVFPACKKQGGEASATPAPAKKIANVSVLKVTAREMVERITLPGTLSPDQQMLVSAEVGGLAERIVPKKGDRVKAGDLIAEIDRKQAKATLDQLEAALRQARLGREEAELAVARGATMVENAARQVQQAGLALAQAEKTREKVQIALTNVTQHHDRIAKLYEEKLASRSAYDDATAALKAAEADLAATTTAIAAAKEGVGMAEGNLSQVKSGVESAKLGVKAAEAGIAAQEAGLSQAKLRYDKGLVTAPYDAFVEEVYFEQGEFVKMESPVVRIVRTDPLKVGFSLPERDIPYVKVGQGTEVGVASLGRTFPGRISFVALGTNLRTNTYPVEIQVANRDGSLRSGMVADVTLVRRKVASAVSVPVFSIITKEEGEVVFVLRDGKAVKRLVKPGIRENGDVEIVEGLTVGEELIVKGHRDLEDGQEVKVL